MPLPFTMTIAGSIPLLIFILLWILQRDRFSIFLGIRLLKISLFFYLVPVQLLYHIIPNSIYYFFKSEKPAFVGSNPLKLSYNNELIVPINGYFLWIPRLIVFLLAMWLIGILIFVFLQFNNYSKLRTALRNYKPHLYTRDRKESIDILNVPYSCSPYSIGFFKSYIVISKELWESEYQRELYRHELCHIQNKDTWTRLLCLGVICVHFYNPMAYLLFFLYRICSECLCDSYAVEGLSPSKKKQYARLLVELAGRKNPLQSVLQNRFSDSKFFLKERINFIMKDTRLKNRKNFFTFIITTLSLLFCTTTIWAYQPPKMTNWNPQTSTQNKDIELVLPEYAYESKYYSEEYPISFSLSDTIIVTENGACLPFEISETPTRASCIHTFQTYDLYEHTLKDNGGCTLKRYKTKLCTKCSYMQSKSLISTTTFAACPHNQ